jgi:tRNA 2-thiouridine synthesizing protein C|tara:strand:- start:269 stop:634 length:366 start_codon:yes stop_codon:yes gene_type:complete
MSEPTKIMFVMRKPPHGSIHAYEGLETVLIAGAYDQDISIVFMGDGVLALKKNQETSELGVKGFAQTYRALEDYDIEKIYVDRETMEDRGLKTDDLVIEPTVMDASEIAKLMNDQHVLFPF